MTDFGWRKYRGAAFTAADPRIEMIPESGCWLWMGTLTPKGYGAAEVRENGHRRGLRAHRAVWETLRGPIPSGLVLDHICRVRSCVNPDHLRVVTPRQNALENSNAVTAINAQKTCCPVCGGPYKRDVFGSRQCSPCRKSYKAAWVQRCDAEKRQEMRRKHVESQQLYVARQVAARVR